MVVLKPILEGEHTKTCRCGHMGLASPVPERSSFHPRYSSKRNGPFNARCRKCKAAESKEYEKKRRPGTWWIERYAREQEAMTEEQHEEQRRKWREAQRRRGHDPKVLKQRAENAKRYRERRSERVDPKVFREIRRMDKNLLKERKGQKKLAPLEKVMAKTATFGESLPIAPFRAWVEEVISSSGERETLAPEFFGITARRLQSWRYEYKSVDYGVVDRAASRHGGTTVDEIYRNAGMIIKTLDDGSFAFVVHQWFPKKGEDGVIGASTMEKTRSCRSPGCEEDPGDGKFCATHVKLFARVKESMDGDSARFKATIRKKDARPTCCNKACGAPRLRSERYCEKCQEDGWDESDIV